MKLPLIPQDKANHFLYGFLIYALSTVFLSAWYDLIPVFAIGIGKEIYDKVSKKGTLDVFDIVFTIIPGVVLTLIRLL